MCLAIPSKVLAIDGFMARVDTAGTEREVNLMLLHEDVVVGDYVLIQHGNFAFERVEPDRAQEALALMQEILAQGEADVRAW